MFQPHHHDEKTIYSFDRSPHYRLISKAIQNRRHRKASTDASSEVKCGLPSPPMESFKIDPPPSTVSGLTKADICVKLQELRDEKHRLFQLIKQQLVQQEQEQSHHYFMPSQYWLAEQQSL